MNPPHAVVTLALSTMLLAAATAATAQPPQPASKLAATQPVAGKLVITGSSTMAPLIVDLARSFQAGNAVAINVESGGSSRGVEDTLAGKADIGMVSRNLKPHEKADLYAITIARDGIAFVVHRDNSVRTITREQIVAILDGRVTNWRGLGGKNAPIHLVTRKSGHSSIELVSEYSGLRVEDIKAQSVAGDNSEARQAVLDNPNAIAFFSFGFAIDSVQQGMPIALLAVDGVTATLGELRADRFPLGRPLNLVTKNVPTGAALAFIQYVKSPAQRAVIEEMDFVPYQ